MTARTRDSLGSLGPLALMLAIVTAVMLLYSRFAHAGVDPVAIGTSIDWMGVAVVIGLVLGGLGVILGGLSTVLHAIAPRTKTTLDDRAANGVDALRAEVATLSGLLRSLIPPGGSGLALDEPAGGNVVGIARGGVVGPLAALQLQQPNTKLAVSQQEMIAAQAGVVLPRNPQAGKARLSTMTAIALVGAALVVIGCTATQRADARNAAASGVVAALNCEDGHLDAAVLADAKLLAADKLQAIISGVAPGDTAALQAKLKAELAPIRSDAGKCAVGGAFDALTALAVEVATGSSPGTAIQGLSARAAAEPPPDPVLIRAAFSAAARDLGWSPIKVGGTVL